MLDLEIVRPTVQYSLELGEDLCPPGVLYLRVFYFKHRSWRFMIPQSLFKIFKKYIPFL